MPMHQTNTHFHFWWLALLISALVFWQLCTITSWLSRMCPETPLVCAGVFPILTRQVKMASVKLLFNAVAVHGIF
jgi:hypothetical protein